MYSSTILFKTRFDIKSLIHDLKGDQEKKNYFDLVFN